MRVLDDDPDVDLMRQTAAGDREAFATLYRRYSATVYRFARLMTGRTSAAEDVVQEVFLALMRDAARYDAERASLSTYLYGIARHQTRRRLQRDRRFVALPDSDVDLPAASAGGAAEHFEKQDDVQRLRRAIVALPSRYREVIVLCDLQDVNYADAAVTLNCAVGTIRSRLHRARSLLSEKMQRARSRANESSMRYAV
jgi:RNA polymerase sigma-70 factor, ECF subfamily